MYYIYAKNNILNGCGQAQCLNADVANIVVTKDIYEDYRTNPAKYIYDGDSIVENPNYNITKLERAKAQKLKENATALEKKDSLNTSLGVIKINTPIGKIDVVVTSMLNIVQITQHNLQAGFLRFYVDGAETPSPEMTPQQVGAFYLEIAQKLKDTDSLYKNYENLIKAAKSIEELEAIELDYGGI